MGDATKPPRPRLSAPGPRWRFGLETGGARAIVAIHRREDRTVLDIIIRPLEVADLDAALAIQAQTYPQFLREGDAAFASRLHVRPSHCIAAVRGDVLVGYLLAHGWAAATPVAVDTVLSPADTVSEVLFIHDLAVSAAGQGGGIGRRMIAHAFELAAHDGLSNAELIAVEGAASYWRGLGFVEAQTSPELAAKVAAYGGDARWMMRAIGPSRIPDSSAPERRPRS